MPFTPAQFKDFLATHNAQQSCPRCGTEGWTYLTESRNSDEMALFDLTSRSGESVPVVQVRCRNCSLLETFAASHVQRWVDDAEAKQAGPGPDAPVGRDDEQL